MRTYYHIRKSRRACLPNALAGFRGCCHGLYHLILIPEVMPATRAVLLVPFKSTGQAFWISPYYMRDSMESATDPVAFEPFVTPPLSVQKRSYKILSAPYFLNVAINKGIGSHRRGVLIASRLRIFDEPNIAYILALIAPSYQQVHSISILEHLFITSYPTIFHKQWI